MENSKKIQPTVYRGDYCRKYAPIIGLKSFLEQTIHTQNELINYLPSKIRKKNEAFKTTQTFFQIMFLTGGLGIMTFCDRIRFIKNTFTNKWALFGLKGSILAVCFWTIFNFQQKVCQENFSNIYRLVKDDYTKYKLSGNFLSLNPSIILVQDTIAPKINISIIN